MNYELLFKITYCSWCVAELFRLIAKEDTLRNYIRLRSVFGPSLAPLIQITVLLVFSPFTPLLSIIDCFRMAFFVVKTYKKTDQDGIEL